MVAPSPPPITIDAGLRRSATRLMAALQELAALRDTAEVRRALADGAGCLVGHRLGWATDLADVLHAAELQAVCAGAEHRVYRDARELVGVASMLRRDGDPALRSAVLHALSEFTTRVRLRAAWVRRARVGVGGSPRLEAGAET